METRRVCQTSFSKDCRPVTANDCMEVRIIIVFSLSTTFVGKIVSISGLSLLMRAGQVTELRCRVELVTNCSMDWTMQDSVESLMSVSNTVWWWRVAQGGGDDGL